MSYREFRTTPVINKIADKRKWTVSTKDKMPVDMYIFRTQGTISGAVFNDEASLVSLDTLLKLIPNVANYAFYLDALFDGICVLDIEGKCPDDIKNRLADMPCLYKETSMSGKGYHMIFPLPEKILAKYPNAEQKIVLKEKHGYYEILLDHYVTFTGNRIATNEPDVLLTSCNPDDFPEFEEVFENLAKDQTASARHDFTLEESDIDSDSVKRENKDPIIHSLVSRMQYYGKTPDDYDGDNSRYEFAWMCHCKYVLEKVLEDLSEIAVKNEHDFPEFTDSEKAWFMYQAALDEDCGIPHRAKHDTERNGFPWLYYLAGEVIAKTNDD